jgi:hypothetical protein
LSLRMLALLKSADLAISRRGDWMGCRYDDGTLPWK